MWFGLLITALAFVTLNEVAQIFASSTTQGAPTLQDPAGVRNVWASAGQAGIMALVVGILGMTTEFRHQTITATFLATPRRGRVVTAKMLVHAGLGVLYGRAA